MMRLSVLAMIAVPALVSAQDGEGPKEDLRLPVHCGDREDLPMRHPDRVCYWWTHSFNAQMVFGAAFNSALDPFFNNSTNAYWGQGAKGFSRRFGTRVSQSMAKGTGQALVGMVFHEDPRFYPSHRDKFWPRFGFALTHTLIVKNDHVDQNRNPDGRERLSAGRIAGAFSSGFVGMAWTPDPINSPRDALVRSGTSMGGVLAGSLWKEFQPDVMRLVSKMFKPAKPPSPMEKQK